MSPACGGVAKGGAFWTKRSGLWRESRVVFLVATGRASAAAGRLVDGGTAPDRPRRGERDGAPRNKMTRVENVILCFL